jgi:hypothetical protein
LSNTTTVIFSIENESLSNCSTTKSALIVFSLVAATDLLLPLQFRLGDAPKFGVGLLRRLHWFLFTPLSSMFMSDRTAFALLQFSSSLL